MSAAQERHVEHSFQNSGREISLNFQTLESSMSLASAALTALVGALAAGELFSDEAAEWAGVPKLSSVSLLVLAVSLPLFIRFFMRAQRGFQNLHRFNDMQNVALRYFRSEVTYAEFCDAERLLIDEWKTPRSFRKVTDDNLKYGFWWIIAVPTGLLLYALVTSSGMATRVAAAGILIPPTFWEGRALLSMRRNYYTRPTDSEQELLDRVVGHQRVAAVAGAKPTTSRRRPTEESVALAMLTIPVALTLFLSVVALAVALETAFSSNGT